MTTSAIVRTHGPRLRPDPARTVLRPFHIVGPEESPDGDERLARIVDRVLSLSVHELEAELTDTIVALERRHGDVRSYLDRRFRDLQSRVERRLDVDARQAQLIGAFFTEEFSIEAAALFNPSAVPHFDQSGLAPGDTRFIMSLRGIGEGHISSLLFRTGVWHANGSTALDRRGGRALGPVITMPSGSKRTAELDFADVPIDERVIFPFLPSQGRGIEDVRLCRFVEDDGTESYRGTFTAFDGMDVRQAVLRTTDFRHFVLRRLDGDITFRKGAAWFPRRIGGRYAMLCKRDDEAIFLALSDDPDTWNGGAVIVTPRFSWEFVQMGNCGSPIEIDEGWLVLTHGVGRARRYCMGAMLLDRDDPTRVLARTPEPLIEPTDDDEGGYVPNVVYSCGSMVRERALLLPYGVADNYAATGTAGIDDILAAMR